MIIFVYGEDTFRSREYVLEQVEKFKRARDPAGYNIASLDGKKEPLGKILDTIMASPFLAERRMVVVNNLLASSDKSLLSAIIEKVEHQKIPTSTVLLVWQGESISKVKEAKELQALLKKEQYQQEFSVLQGAQLTNWISKTCQQRGAVIAPAAAEYVAANTSGDMWLVSSLLNQLVAYKNGARIERRDAEIFLDQKNNDTIFAAIDAVAEGNTRKALLLLASERREGTEEGFIFSMLVRQFKILLQLKDLENREKASPETAAKLLGLPPFVVKKSAGILRRYTLLELTERYRVLAEIDLKMKSGIAPQTLLTDLFVVSLERSIKL